MYSNHLIKSTIVFIIVIFTITGCSYNNTNNNHPRAEAGILDLTKLSLQEELIELDGQWDFYWMQLLEPEDFLNSHVKDVTFIELPRAWNGYEVNNELISGDGYATYRLIINTNSSDKLLGLRIPRILTSYKMWVNNEVLASAGAVSINKEAMIPQYLPQVILFKPEQNEIDIVIQVSNYRHRSGGILESLSLGDSKQILQLRYKNIAYELFLFGCLLIMGIYHLALFAFRRKNLSPLYFGMFCIFIAVRTLLVGEIFFIYLFPNFSWEIAHKIQTLSFYLGVPIILMFFKSVFPTEVSNIAVKANQAIAISFGLMVLFTPVSIFTRFNSIFQIFALVSITYILYILVLIIYKKKTGAWFIGMGALVLIATSINDIIFLSTWMNDNSNNVIRYIFNTGNLSSFGQLIFVFTHSLVLANKFSNALVEEEKIVSIKQELNESLEQLVYERTEALELSNKKIKQQKTELQKANKALHLLSLIDPLTNIWNHRHFDKTLNLEWKRGQLLKKSLCLILIDIDYFKDFNDYYGHQAGDVCLIQVAQVLEHTFNRPGNLVARYGGEEFVVIIPDIFEGRASDIAESFRLAIVGLKLPHHASPISKYVTVSLGVATMIPDTNSSIKDLILAADIALYSAKAEGRNMISSFQTP